ncbi:MAG TPA: hypothetical protein O0X19_05860 [Methanocorpusculum sp.]|nr:hypothetical protein [Methanocorpusculum sp.]HJJ33878.1 hypothetical protein [Methanocorpusculum sp.]HJJ45323.1 hypothetical protein [Methanocorpusculum sp.]HJJ57993.1 hypothetical protein [Methanocorpusculum sp.]HJJ59778.1 hypothetical protein [Methanocorpusculum sp.]
MEVRAAQTWQRNGKSNRIQPKSLLSPAARPRPAIDENRRLEAGAGTKGMRLKRG